MQRPFQAVFFDLDGTLRLPDPAPTDAFIFFARSIGITIYPETERRVKLWSHHYWGQDGLVNQDFDRFSKEEFWFNYSKQLLEAANVVQDIHRRAELVHEWFSNHYDPHVALAPGTREVLPQLREEGYKLALITNRSQPVNDELDKLELTDYFDFILAAGEIGIWKPNPAIFDHAIAQFDGLQAANCVYIGDNYYADGYGAERAGLTPIMFDPDYLYRESTFARIEALTELIPLLLTLRS